MHEPGRSHSRALGLGLALVVALGLLLMHGLDAHATASGHGLATAPSALISEISAAAPSSDEPVFVAEMLPDHAMVGLCLAVLAVGLILLAGIFSFARMRAAGKDEEHSSWVGAVAAPWSRRAPPPVPRIALCVWLS